MPEKKIPPGQEKKVTSPQGKDRKEPPGPQEHAAPPPQPQSPPAGHRQEPTPWPETKPDTVPPPGPPPHHEEGARATIQFLPGWEQRRRGQVRRGGKLVVEFDPARLPQCRQSSHGAQVWEIEVGMIFHPGGQWFVGSVMRKVRMPEGGPLISLEPQPYEVTVPADATRVEMWFKNYTTIGGRGCEAWDSRYCQNYWFDVGE
jgi:hypothetical protein